MAHMFSLLSLDQYLPRKGSSVARCRKGVVFSFSRFATLSMLIARASCLDPEPSLLRRRQELDSDAIIHGSNDEQYPTNQTHRHLVFVQDNLEWHKPKEEAEYRKPGWCGDELKSAPNDKLGFGYKRDCQFSKRNITKEEFYYRADPFDRRFDCCVKGRQGNLKFTWAACEAITNKISWKVCGIDIEGTKTLYPKTLRDEQFEQLPVITKASVEGKKLASYSYTGFVPIGLSSSYNELSTKEHLDRSNNEIGTGYSDENGHTGWNKLEITLERYRPTDNPKSKGLGEYACEGHDCWPVSFCNKFKRLYDVPSMKIFRCKCPQLCVSLFSTALTPLLRWHAQLKHFRCRSHKEKLQ